MKQTAPPAADIPPPPTRTHPRPVLRWLLLLFAVLCLALGTIGVFVPGLPTTIFILMAAWAAARSSPRLHAWLWYHRHFGSMLRDWAQGQFVRRSAKWKATVAMAVCMVALVLTASQGWAAAIGCGFMACVLVWLWFRPEPLQPLGDQSA